MNKHLLHILGMLSAIMLLTACDDILDKTSKTAFMDSPTYWSNVSEVSSYVNDFYNNFSGYGENGFYGWFYYQALSDDQVNPEAFNFQFYTIPSRSGYWDDNFTQVKRANTLMQNVRTSTMTQELKTRCVAIARLNRAWAYFQLVREFGDVPWTKDVITTEDDNSIVCGNRISRDIVVDSVVADLDYAIDNLSETTDKTLWSSDLALAIKSDVCLFEGTYCKYRTKADNGKAPDKERATKYLKLCVNASEAIITRGGYSLTKNYGEVYNSTDLSRCPEIIFFRNYEKEVMTHGLITATCNAPVIFGITKDAFDSFLFLDGKPKATTSLDNSDSAVINNNGNYSISPLLKVRDKRLSVLTDSIVYFKNHTWSRPNSNGFTSEMASSTGYGIRKFDNTTLETNYRTGINTNYTDAPLFWYAVILLNDAEALAELGSITQDDLDVTVNLLQHRAGLPSLTLRPAKDPANNMHVSNLIYEIRRIRRCELMCDNWYRYWDLIRWHQLDKLDSKQHPDVALGAKVGNNYIVATKEERVYKPRYYFFPVPTAVLKLNPNIQQNPGWQS